MVLGFFLDSMKPSSGQVLIVRRPECEVQNNLRQMSVFTTGKGDLEVQIKILMEKVLWMTNSETPRCLKDLWFNSHSAKGLACLGKARTCLLVVRVCVPGSSRPVCCNENHLASSLALFCGADEVKFALEGRLRLRWTETRGISRHLIHVLGDP